MREKLLDAAVAGLLALVLLSMCGPKVSAADASSFASRHVLWHLNIERAEQGQPYLRRDLSLDAVARVRTAALAHCGCLFHDLALSARSTHFASLGEIVGWTTADHTWLVAAFMSSPPHRAVILGHWDRFGAAVVTTPDGRLFATVIFGGRP